MLKIAASVVLFLLFVLLYLLCLRALTILQPNVYLSLLHGVICGWLMSSETWHTISPSELGCSSQRVSSWRSVSVKAVNGMQDRALWFLRWQSIWEWNLQRLDSSVSSNLSPPYSVLCAARGVCWIHQSGCRWKRNHKVFCTFNTLFPLLGWISSYLSRKKAKIY